MIRIVLDANIYVSALEFGGRIDQLLYSSQMQDFHLVVSASIRLEVEDILARKFGWRRKRIDRLSSTVWSYAEQVQPDSIPPVCRDPKDDHVLGTCVAGRADVLVTGDGDLLVLRHYKNTMIVTPGEFISEILDAKL